MTRSLLNSTNFRKKVNTFNAFFLASVFNSNDRSRDAQTSDLEDHLGKQWLPNIVRQQIWTFVKSIGFDGIHPRALKEVGLISGHLLTVCLSQWELGGAFCFLEGWEALQRDLDAWEHWAIISTMKCNKAKCRCYTWDGAMLNTGRGWGMSGWRAAQQRGTWGCKWQQLSRSHWSAWQPRGKSRLGCIKHSSASWSKSVVIPLYLMMMQPHFEYCVHFWAPRYKKGVKNLESFQRKHQSR